MLDNVFFPHDVIYTNNYITSDGAFLVSCGTFEWLNQHIIALVMVVVFFSESQ